MNKHKQMARKWRIAAIVAAVGVFAIIGGVIAYNGNFSIFRSFFGTYYLRDEITDEFVSPDNWQPCQATPKTITYKNEGSMPTVARLKYEEYWKLKNSTDTSSTTELPLTPSYRQNPVVITTVLQSDGWELHEDGYYYTTETIKPGEYAQDFILSMEIDCGFDFAKSTNRTDTSTGTTYESVNSEYSDAKFHVLVTVNSQSAEDNTWCDHEVEGDCPVEHRETLYDHIAKQTRGIDDGIMFSYYTDSFTSSLPGANNGEGVNTLAAHANDRYPVYYYRGRNTLNNVVMFYGYCWRIVRTAERGAVKLIYAGNYSGGCSDTTSSNSGLINNGNSVYYHNGNYYGYVSSISAYRSGGTLPGYMTKYQTIDDNKDYVVSYYNSQPSPIMGKIAESVTWDGSYYHLVDPHDIVGTPYYSYACMKLPYEYIQGSSSYTTPADKDDATEDTCRNVIYWTPGYGNGNGYYLRFMNGTTVEDYINDSHTNKYDSNLKKVIDTWFEGSNLRGALAAGKLADVGYCNDRTSTYSPLSSPNGHYGKNYVFDSYVRTTGMINNNDATPSIDCADARDNFTVNSAFGNGDLKYPIATITADEVSLAGIPFRGGYDDIDSSSYSWNDRHGLNYYYYDYNYLYGYNSYFTMSPLMIRSSYYQMQYVSGMNLNGTYSTGVRPMIAVKYNTYITSGSGTLADPYILQ